VRRLPVFALIVGLFGLISCHKYTAPTSTAITCTTTTSTSTTTSSSSCTDPVTGISIGIAPPTVSVIVATPTQFLKAVSGGTNDNVTWQVNGMTGGNDTVGRIDSTGKYIAPSAVPSPATVTVAVVPSGDPNLSVTSAVTILPPPLVTISPTSWTLTSGTANTKMFTATVTGAPTTNVDWQVNGVLGGNATFGTIDATGVYTAPLTPPIGSTVTVTAVSRDFPLSMAPAMVTISGYSSSSFHGPFAFSLSGRNASGAFFRAGSFVANGAGLLSGGLEDINAPSCATTNPISFVGSYTVGSDGRGTMQFTDGCTPATFSFVLVNNNQLQIIGFDATGTATGQANSQDISAFHVSDFSGTYVFDFTGLHGSSALSQIGELTSDGQGHITGGSIDINDGGTSGQFQITGNTAPPSSPPSYPSTYSIDLSTGRGALTIATSDPAFQTLTFSFYIVSRGAAKFVGTGTTQASAGVTTQQAPNATFDGTSLNGNYAFLLAGSGSGGAIATAGSFVADGNGLLTTGVVDENGNGAPPSNVAFSSGSFYKVTSNGRGIAMFTAGSRNYSLVFYLGATGNAVLQEIDSSITSDGSFARQQGAPFSTTSIQGSYAMQATGLSAGAVQTLQGQLNADGSGKVPSGTVDVSKAGTPPTSDAVSGTYSAPSSNGRSALSLNPTADIGNFAAYVVNPTQVFVVGIDTGHVAAGAMYKRF
jgi:hypothetical protein